MAFWLQQASKEKPSPFLKVVDGLLAAGAAASLLLLDGIGRGASSGPEDSSVNLAEAASSIRAAAFGEAAFFWCAPRLLDGHVWAPR